MPLRFTESGGARSVGWAFVLAVCTSLVVSPSVAVAQDIPDAEAHYRELIVRAVTAFQARDFTQARALFEEAHDLQPSARTYRGIGMAAFEMGDYAGAAPALEAALSDARNPLTPAQAVEVHDLLDRCRHAGFVLHVELAEPLTRLSVDGIDRDPRVRSLLLNPGQHRIEVEVEGYARFSTTYRAGAGGQAELSAIWHGEPLVAQPSDAQTGQDGDEGADARAPRWKWALLGGAGAAAVVAFGTGARAASIYDELDRVCTGGVCPASYHGEGTRGDRLRTTSIVMWSAAGASAVGALAAWLLERRSRDEEPPRAQLGPGPGTAGLAVHGRF